jgi:FAD-dependent urate hydroxylase
MNTTHDVVIIGAGPYGLAAAAHLRSAGMDAVVFGETMSFWKRNLPQGMFLRSPWRGTHIADPDKELTLDHFVLETGLPRREPIPLDMFIRYGEWFQKRIGPVIEDCAVTRVEALSRGFSVTLSNGETRYALRIVVATGLTCHSYRPPQFAGLPVVLATHSSEHRDLGRFRGRHVAVVGAGQSAVESAAIISESGAEVELIGRVGALNWIGRRPGADGLLQRTIESLSPPSPVGPFPMNWLVEKPTLMHHLPLSLRRLISTRGLRPAAASWLRPRAEGVRLRLGRVVVSATRRADSVHLQLDDGSRVEVDHVLLATGYRINVNNYSFLTPKLISAITSSNGNPELARGMESSVPGLHFLGASAVWSYGPIMRFVWGAGYAARKLVTHLVGRAPERVAATRAAFAGAGSAAERAESQECI